MTTTPSDAGSTGSVRLHRIVRCPPDRIYRAFLDPDAMVKFVPPYGFTGKVHEIDVRVGGGYRMSFTNFGTGKSHSFGGTYVELVANERIVYTDRFDDPALPGQMRVAIALRPVACGTELSIVQEGVPAVIPLEFCYAGWQETLQQLAHLVEPEIPDEG
ncbi:MAG: SRPBCC family protein [Planctomycetes bacterium]|nr:SRPBCC family protein [Planctomycetota bacterium]